MTDISFATPWTAAVVQAAVRYVTSEDTAKATQHANALRIAEQIDRIVQTYDPPPRLLVYPVLVLTGGRRETGIQMETVAIELPGDEFQPIVDACRRNNCYFASSAQEKTSWLPGRYFHTAFVLGPEGLVLRSPMAQAFSAPETTALRDMFEEYEAAFGARSVQPVARTELGTIGCLIQAEQFVPEAARVLRAKGAEIIVHPNIEFANPGRVDSLAVRQTLALTSGVYFLSAATSRVIGYGEEAVFLGGRSAIIGPEGYVDAVGGPACDAVLVGTIDPERLRAVREKFARITEPAARLFRDLYQ
jgi:predicted amidohydrolase